MWSLNKSFTLLIIGLLLSSATVAATDDSNIEELVPNIPLPDIQKQIRLQGDYVDIDSTGQRMVASGNVRAQFRDTRLRADRIEYDFKTNSIHAPGRIQFQNDNNDIQAYNLHYNGKTYKGGAENIKGNLGRFYIQGESLSISPRRSTIKEAFFTSCDLEDPHYAISSKRIYIYPVFGFFVANGNRLHLRQSPISIWAPAYFYGSANYSLLALAPIPQFGSTPREGFFVRHGIPYYINSQSNGSVSVGHTKDLGWEYGVTHIYTYSPSKQLILKAGSVGTDGFSGGAIFTLDLEELYGFGRRNDSIGESFFGAFTGLTSAPKGVLKLQYSYGELINNSRVDFIPRMVLDFNRVHLTDRWTYTTHAEGAYIEENTLDRQDISGQRYIITAKTNYQFEWLSDWVHSDTSYEHVEHYYDNHDDWSRSFFTISAAPKIPILSPRFTFSKQLHNNGDSPFEFDKAFIQETDEVNVQLEQQLGRFKFNYNAAFQTNSGRARLEDYSLTFFLHRVQLQVGYRVVQEAIYFGGTL